MLVPEKVVKRVGPLEEEIVQVEEEEMVEETVEEMARLSEETMKTKGKKVSGAPTYKSSFNNEWTSK